MTEREMRFVLGALLDLMAPALMEGEDIDGEMALQTLAAAGLTTVHPEDGIVLTAFADGCIAEFLNAVLRDPKTSDSVP